MRFGRSGKNKKTAGNPAVRTQYGNAECLGKAGCRKKEFARAGPVPEEKRNGHSTMKKHSL